MDLTPWYGTGEVDPRRGQYVLFENYTVLVTGADGTIDGTAHHGLFDHDTRVLSIYRLRLDGAEPRVDSAGLLSPAQWLARLTVPRPGGNAQGPLLPQDLFEIEVHRRLNDGLRERLVVHNRSATPAVTTLVLTLDGDFRDVADLDSPAGPPGHVQRTFDPQAVALTFDYRASHNGRALNRALRLRVNGCETAPRLDEAQLTFDLRLDPFGTWSAELLFETFIDGEWHSPAAQSPLADAREAVRRRWSAERTHIESNPPAFGLVLERAAEDLLALRNWDHDAAPDAWIPNAGVPTYTGLFGRDSLTVGWQSAMLGPEIMRGAIAQLAATQATSDSPWHDAEPGKMIHESRRGPLSELDIIPHSHYYGTQTSASMFVVVLSELWHWTGALDVLRRYRDAALRTFEWADRYGDRDGDGFLEYTTRSPRGLKNQGWKDSDEAIRYPDGRIVENPIATVEEQAYHCIALERMAEILTALGETRHAALFIKRARRLRAHWHDVFWIPHEGFYAMALDSTKRQVASAGSNPGHGLAAGIVPRNVARQVADRLLAPDLFSGWGIRTLSSQHASFNPLAYHLGTVWPVENATFAIGFKRYGLDDHVERLVTAMMSAASHFRSFRLPEALGGHSQAEAPIPTVYPASNTPQAWSASATLQLAQALLGLYPFAPAHMLVLVRPTLPRWLSMMTLRNLRVGSARVTLRFVRTPAGTTTYRVIDKTGRLHVLEMPPPQGAEPGARRWKDAWWMWLLGHAPGRLAHCLRLALGEMPIEAGGR